MLSANLPSQDLTQVQQAVIKFIQAYSDKDVDACIAAYAQELPVFIVGTGEGEYCSRLDQLSSLLQRDFQQSGPVKIAHKELSTQSYGNIACAASELDIEVSLPDGSWSVSGRFTCTLVKANEQWKIVQSHLSVPAADQAEGESFGKDLTTSEQPSPLKNY